MTFSGALPTIGAQVVIQGLAQFNTAHRQVVSAMNNMNRASMDLGKASQGGWDLAAVSAKGGAVAIVAATAAVITAVVDLGAQYEKALRPAIVWGKANSDQAKMLSRDVLELSRSYTGSATEIAKSAGALSRAGSGYKDIHDGALEAVTALVAVSDSELDAARAGELVVQMTTSYKKQNLTALEAANALAGAVQTSTGTWQDLYLSFKQIIPLFADMGVSAKDSAVAMAIMWQEGIRGETAGTSVRNAFLKMINPTKEVSLVMLRYGLRLFDTNKKSLGLQAVIQQLNSAFGDEAVASGKITKQQSELALSSLGLSRSMLAVLVLARTNTAAFEEWQKKMEGVDVTKIAKELSTTLIDQLSILLNQIKAFSITFTEGFINTLTKGTYAINQFLRSAVSLDTIQAFAKVVGDTVGKLGEMKDALLGTSAVQNVFKTFGATFTAAVAIAKNLGDTLSAIWNHPGLRKYINSILDGFNKLLGVTTDISQGAFGKLLIAVVAVSEAIKTGVVEALNAIPYERIAAGVTDAFNRVTAFFQKDVVNLFNSWSTTIAKFWADLPRLAQEGVNNIVPFIQGIIQNVSDAVTGAYQAVINFAVGIAQSITATINNTFGGIITGVAAAVDGIWTIVSTIAGDIFKVWQSAFLNIMKGVQPLIDLFNEAFPGAANVLVGAAKAAIVIGIVAYKLFQQNSERQAKANQTLAGYLGKLWDSYVAQFLKLWNDVGTFLSNAWNKYIDLALAFFNFLGGALQTSFKYWADYWRNIAADAQTAIKWIVDKLSGFFDWLEQQPIIGSKVKEIRTMFTEAAASVDSFFSQVGDMPKQVIDAAKAAFESVDSTFNGIVKGISDQVDAAFGGVGANLVKIFEDAKTMVAGMIPNVGGAVASVQGFIDRMMAAAQASVARTKADLDALMKNAKGAATTVGTITLVPMGKGQKPEVAPPEPGDLLTQKAENFKWIKGLLRDIPLMNDEMAKFVAEIAEADPTRLDPIVAFFHSQAGTLHEIGESLKRQLEIELKIAQVDQQLEQIAIQRKAIELARESALLPFEIKLAELAQRKNQLDQQALPIEQKIADIDKQIALAQRENLGLQRQRLLIQQAMIPLQEKMQAIDKAIAEAGKTNYGLERQRLEVENQLAPINEKIEDIERRRNALDRENFDLARRRVAAQINLASADEKIYQIDQAIARIGREDFDLNDRRIRTQIDMLGIKTQIEDIDKRISAASKVDYDLTIRNIRNEQAMLPIKHQMAALDKQIADTRKEDFDLNDRRLRTQRDMLEGQQRLHDVERRINDAQRTNYEALRIQAQLDTAALDARLAIRDIEQQISDIVDKRQQLTMRRDELVAQHAVELRQRELDRVTKQLDELWAQFNFRSGAGLGAGAASLIPGITDLERQKTDLESLLKGLNANLDSIQQSQADINFQNELSTIALQLEQQEQEAILRPIQDRIDLLERQQLVERTRSAEELANLEAERQAIQDQLQPYQDILDAIDAQAQATDLTTQIIVNGLSRQKAELALLLQPYQDVADQIAYVQQITQTEQDLTIAGLQRERELLLGQLQPYQDILTNLDRQTERVGLYNDLAINGLNRQKQALEDLRQPYVDQLHAIDLETTSTQLLREQQDIQFREELQHLRDLAQPLEDKRLAITREEAAQQRVRDLVINYLNDQKQKLQALLQPYQDQLDKLDQITLRESVQRDLVINLLDTQKRKLEDSLAPINNQRDAIDRQTAALNLQKDAIAGAYDLQLLRLQQITGPLEAYRNSLEGTRLTEQGRLNDLIQRFQDAINKSNLFTSTEAADIPRRLGWWNDEVTKVTSLRDRLNDVQTSMTNVGNSFNPIPQQSGATEAAFQRLRDVIGNAGANNTLTANANAAVGAIGSANGGLVAAFNNLTTPLNNANTSAGNLRTALNDIGGGTLGASLDTLRYRFSGNISSLEQHINNAASAGRTFRDLLWADPNNSIATNANRVGENLAGAGSLKERLSGTNFSVGSAFDAAKGQAQNFKDMLWGQSFSVGQYSANVGGDINGLRDKIFNGDPAANHLHHAFAVTMGVADQFRGVMYGNVWSVNKAINDLGIDVNNFRTGKLGSQYDVGTLTYTVDQARIKFNDWKQAINDAASALRTFPTGTVNVSKTGFATGGIVPGAIGAPMLATVHGGERIIPTSAGVGPNIPTRAATASTVINNTIINYNMSASYERYQDPITVDQNLRTLVAMSRR